MQSRCKMRENPGIMGNQSIMNLSPGQASQADIQQWVEDNHQKMSFGGYLLGFWMMVINSIIVDMIMFHSLGTPTSNKKKSLDFRFGKVACTYQN